MGTQGSESGSFRRLIRLPRSPSSTRSRGRVAMIEKSDRRRTLEQNLAEDPEDTFLRYGLAIQCLREGDLEEGRTRLRALIGDHPDDQIPAYQQLGMSFVESGEKDRA